MTSSETAISRICTHIKSFSVQGRDEKMSVKVGKVNQCFELRGEKTEDDLTCAICLNLFTAPKTLPCGHSFCGICIKRVIQNNIRAKILCPKCKAQHSKHTLTDRLKLNMRLQTAVMRIQNLQIPKFLPKDLVPTQRISSSGLFFKEQVMSVTMLADENVCFTTNSGICCHRRVKGEKSLAWTKDLEGVTSLSSNDRYIFASQRRDELVMVDGAYTCWIIHILSYKGVEIGQIHGGLGQDCYVTSLPDGWLAIADTGSYSFHAQPCLMLLAESGEEREVLTATSQRAAMIKPTRVLASTDRSQLLVFDAGDNYLKCYRSFENNLRKYWQAHVKSYITMTTDSTNSVIVILMKKSIDMMTFGGENLTSIDFNWNRELVRDVCIHDSYLTVCAGKEACVYRIISTDDDSWTEESV